MCRADSRLAPNQWETSLQCNTVSHWLGANLESALLYVLFCTQAYSTTYNAFNGIIPSWWRHPMEIFSALLAICAGNSPVTGEFPPQMPLTRSFDVFVDLRLNKQSWGWWFETSSRELCVTIMIKMMLKNSDYSDHYDTFWNTHDSDSVSMPYVALDCIKCSGIWACLVILTDKVGSIFSIKNHFFFLTNR